MIFIFNSVQFAKSVALISHKERVLVVLRFMHLWNSTVIIGATLNPAYLQKTNRSHKKCYPQMNGKIMLSILMLQMKPYLTDVWSCVKYVLL